MINNFTTGFNKRIAKSEKLINTSNKVEQSRTKSNKVERLAQINK